MLSASMAKSALEEKAELRRLLKRHGLVGVAEARAISRLPETTFYRYLRNINIVAETGKDLICLPEPIVKLQCGSIWLRTEMEAFGFYVHQLSPWSKPRKSGRRPKPEGS